MMYLCLKRRKKILLRISVTVKYINRNAITSVLTRGGGFCLNRFKLSLTWLATPPFDFHWQRSELKWDNTKGRYYKWPSC
jgi:hypothetical protein